MQVGLAAPLATSERLVSPTGKEAVRAYREAEFLNVPAGESDSLWRVRNGGLQTSKDGGVTWLPAASDLLPRPLSGDWEGIRLAGAVAVGKEPFTIDYSLGPEFDFKALAIVGEVVFEFGRKLNEIRPGYFVPEITVLKRNANTLEGKQVSTFQIGEENLQYRLGAALPFSDTLIGLAAGSEHPYANSLVLFDVTVNQPVGYLPYSELSYSPSEKTFRVVEPLTRAQDTPEALEEARKRSRTVPLLIDGKLNPDLVETDLFAFQRSVSEPPEPPKAPATPPPGENARPLQSAPTGSEVNVRPEPIRIRTAIWLAIGAVVFIGLGWVVLRRKR